MMVELLSLLIGVAGLGLLIYAYFLRSKAQQLLYKAEVDRVAVEKEITAERREAMFRLKDELQKRRQDFKNELKREQLEIEKAQNRLTAQREALKEKEEWISSARASVQESEKEYVRLIEQAKHLQEQLREQNMELSKKLETVAMMSQEEAKEALFQALEKEVRASHERWLQKMEEEVRSTAKERASRILIDTMQRYTSDCVAGSTSCVIQLPNDDMKGRIIGKEGRNIKVLELSTGVDIIIDDTPEIITLSSFNPVRREVARRSIEKLLVDGRINPSRIEETVSQVEREVQEIIAEKGKDALNKVNVHNVAPELIQLLGELHFRTSFSQDVLVHSIEVASMARMLAEELGLPRPDLAARAGLFHDIGKVVSCRDCSALWRGSNRS
ncbi:MAG: Ribonuclease Y [candidate division TM6 bacterium GW2011_GWF2_43_17]|nr:MAG: Ribonuclease Y [candidate division TM6 bacterium GW2011_GWF2_43_17]